MTYLEESVHTMFKNNNLSQNKCRSKDQTRFNSSKHRSIEFLDIPIKNWLYKAYRAKYLLKKLGFMDLIWFNRLNSKISNNLKGFNG